MGCRNFLLHFFTCPWLSLGKFFNSGLQRNLNVSKKAFHSKFEENPYENMTSNAAIHELSTHTKMLSDTCSHILFAAGNATENRMFIGVFNQS